MDLFIFILNIIGTIAFAASGAILAIDKKMDIFGVAALGTITAVGGGFIRDVTLGNVPPETFKTPVYALVAVGVSIIMFIPGVRKAMMKNRSFYDLMMFGMDSVGLGVFTVVGITYCMNLGFDGFFLNLFVGIITGVGGGVFRDILACDMPFIFRKHIYACASAAGAIITFLLYNVTEQWIATTTGVLSIIIIRCFSAYFRWNLPSPKAKSE